MGHRTCSVTDCSAAILARGYCNAHYKRLKRYGDPALGAYRMRKGAPLGDRLLDRVDSSDPNACWEWQGARLPHGYGKIRVNGPQIHAHRAAYLAWVGEIPDGLWVLHRCDNPPCINPRHLFLGDAAANIADMDAKGRRVTATLSRGWKGRELVVCSCGKTAPRFPMGFHLRRQPGHSLVDL